MKPEPKPGPITAAEFLKELEAAKAANATRKPAYPREKETTLPVETILHPYGVGIDTHKKFIQICVLIKEGDSLRSIEREAKTAWKSLGDAADWIMTILIIQWAGLLWLIATTRDPD